MNTRTPVRVMLEIVVQRADGREERYEVAQTMAGGALLATGEGEPLRTTADDASSSAPPDQRNT